MLPEQIIAAPESRDLPRAGQPVRSSRARRRLAVARAPRADPRDACGLKWQLSCSGWPFFIRLIRWALRDSHD
jgi:hypothetical protein